MATVQQALSARYMPVTRVGALPLYLITLLPVVGWGLGGGLWYWLTPVVLLLIAPLLDQWIGEDARNVPLEAARGYEQNLWYRISLWLFFPLQVAVMLLCYDLATSGRLSGFEVTGIVISNAIAVGIGGTLAHELCHRASRFDRFMGVMVFGACGMANFLVYHVYGHHNLVASPEDPGSAKFGERFWSFTWRNIYGKWKLSWRIEAERLRRLGLHPAHPRNLMLWLTALDIAWFGGLTWYFGWIALIMFPLQYAVIRVLLSVGDYLEHYGLARRRTADGQYEKPRPVHAWDDGYVVSSLLLCVVNRHADHHANEARPFQTLRYCEEAPRYPHGNLVMMYCAFIPPLWRRIVHPVVLEFYRRDEVVPHALPGWLPPDLEHKAVH